MKILTEIEEAVAKETVDTQKIEQALKSWRTLNTSLKDNKFGVMELRLMVAHELNNKNRPDMLKRVVTAHNTVYGNLLGAAVKTASVDMAQKKSIDTLSKNQNAVYQSVE
jgi:hypothetical protein